MEGDEGLDDTPNDLEPPPQREPIGVPVWFLAFLNTLAWELEVVARDDSDPLTQIARIIRKLIRPSA